MAPWAGDYWGNGGQWAASAAAAGFRTGSQPQVGAIACWNDGGYGHVAVVTAVQSTTSIKFLSLTIMVSVVLVTTVVGLTQQQHKVPLLISIKLRITLKQNICSASF